MAVTGVFTADFSNFDKAVQQSEANLGKLDAAGGKVSRSLALMTAEQEKLLTSIGAAGGRVGVLAEGAVKTDTALSGLAGTFGKVDGALAAMGLRIAPQVAGLVEIGTAATAGAASLGALGTAGAILATAMTGWKVGRAVADFLGLDAAIESATMSLMGWNTVQQESAGAGQDIINRVKTLTGETMSLGAARKYLADQAQIATDKDINWRGVLADAHREVRNLSDATKENILIAKEANATTEQITNKYGVSALAIGILAEQTDRAAAAQSKLNAEQQTNLDMAAARQTANAEGVALMERDARLMADRAKFDAEQLAIQNAKLAAGKGYMDQLSNVARLTREATEFDKAYATEQAALDAENQKVIDSIGGMAAAHTEAGAAAEASTLATVGGYQAVAQQVEITSDGVRGWLELMRATNAANALLSTNSLFTTGSMYENLSRIGTANSPLPSFASGVQNFSGGLAKVHGGEVLANLAPGTSVFPKGSGFGGATISNVFNLVDTESNLARRVSAMIMRQVQAGTQLGQA